MRKFRATQALPILVAGGLLAACLSPVAAGVLVCLSEGAAPDCCRSAAGSHRSPDPDGERLVEAAGCDCCIRVDALASSVGTSPQQGFLNLAAQAAHVLPSRTPAARSAILDGPDERLSSLRSVVLLI